MDEQRRIPTLESVLSFADRAEQGERAIVFALIRVEEEIRQLRQCLERADEQNRSGSPKTD